MTIRQEAFSVQCEDGVTLKGKLLCPTEPKAVVQFNAGTAAKKEFYQAFLEYLVEHDYLCCLWDYRGNGESAPASLADCTYTCHEYGIQDNLKSGREGGRYISTSGDEPNMRIHTYWQTVKFMHSIFGRVLWTWFRRSEPRYLDFMNGLDVSDGCFKDFVDKVERAELKVVFHPSFPFPN